MDYTLTKLDIIGMYERKKERKKENVIRGWFNENSSKTKKKKIKRWIIETISSALSASL